MAEHNKEPVVVLGLGRFGSSLALSLVEHGTEVLAVDVHPKIVQGLAGQLTHVVTADTTDMEALQQLGIGDFRRAVVAIGTDLEASILTATLLTDLGIEDIWAKAISRQHGQILERIGVHHVVLPEHDMGERVAHLVGGRALDYAELAGGFAMVKMRPPPEIVGVPLAEIGLWAKRAVEVSYVKRPAADFVPTAGDTVLNRHDVIVIGGSQEAVERFVDLG